MTAFTEDQARRLAAINAARPAPESFDPIAALRRVEALADELDERAASVAGAQSYTAKLIRDALRAAIAGQP